VSPHRPFDSIPRQRCNVHRDLQSATSPLPANG
jgi:hypothetical protein